MDPEGLLESLKVAVRSCIGSAGSVAVAYSGGLDSSIVAALARMEASASCYVCAVEGACDERMAARETEDSRLTVTPIIVNAGQVRDLVARTAVMLGTRNPITAAYSAPIICVLENAKEEVVLAGNGADELFGGYAKYVGAPHLETMMAADLEKAQNEAQAMRAAASTIGKKLQFPFLEGPVLEASRKTAIDQKVSGQARKVILRQVAGILDLQAKDTPKKAAQYSSGMLRCMERLAREEGLSLAEWFVEIASPPVGGQSN